MIRTKLWCMVASCAFCLLTNVPVSAQVQAGLGSYATSGNFTVPDHNPVITSDFSQKVICAKWWATLINNSFSQPLWAHPISYQTNAGGLDMGYPGAAVSTGGGFSNSHNRDLTVGMDGLNATSSPVSAHSHFGVTARWTSGAMTMEATMAQGIPFTYFKMTGGNAKVSFAGTPTIWYSQGSVVAATVNGHNWAVFAPTGSTWSGSGTMTSSLSGKDYLSVALLPDNSAQTLAFFTQYAYSFVKDTRVTWNYDEPSAILTSFFSVVTEAKEGTASGTIFAVFRHQWLEMPGPFLSYTYQSARGVMKTVAGQNFAVPMKFNGILVSMPAVGFDMPTLQNLVNGEGIPASIGAGGCTYNKDMGKYAQLAQIADVAGNTAKRDAIVTSLKSSLQNWFTADGQPEFYYHKPWNRLIGYPPCYYSDTRLTDHHFHYGYYLRAAACVAQWDTTWAKPENWGGMVQMLIRDVNSWDDNDPLFGRFGYFEPYEGHGWADGTGFATGTNQESSSESMNFNAGLILYGVMTGNKVLRDEGIFMYVNEARAIGQYWWDVDNVTFPTAYTHTCVGMVWSNGGAYSTWFSGAGSAIHGINFLPNTSGHLYYGRYPDYNPLNYNEGFDGGWSDLFYEFLAYSDGATAMSKYNGGTSIEAGNTKAACYLEISSLNTAGRLDTSVTGSTPTFAVFDKGTTRTYCAFNPDISDKTVNFNDGFSMVVPSKKQVCTTGPVKPVGVTAPVERKTLTSCSLEKIAVLGGAVAIPRLGAGIQKIELYDLSGKKVWESLVMSGKPVVRALTMAKGIYMLRQYR
ncbi:MAG TPA: glycosyl hydrolase [Chitinivibrionales bacterium]|nr:glycosyl hydrolase [Chitinivibrionales bacterium]